MDRLPRLGGRPAGRPRARFLLARLMARARELQVGVPAMVSSDYINTIPPEQEPWFPGDEHIERRVRAFIRWNAMAMVTRANRRYDGLGGHLSTYASSASLYEVGFNHFFHGKSRRRLRRPGLHPGPRRPRRLRPGLPRGPPHRGPARPLPPGGRRRRAAELSPPAADARLLGVPDGVDGPRPAQRRLPGPVQPLPAAPPDRRHLQGQGVVLRRRRRDGRAGVDGRLSTSPPTSSSTT